MNWMHVIDCADYNQLRDSAYMLSAALWSTTDYGTLREGYSERLHISLRLCAAEAEKIAKLVEQMEDNVMRGPEPDPKPASDDNTASTESEEA